MMAFKAMKGIYQKGRADRLPSATRSLNHYTIFLGHFISGLGETRRIASVIQWSEFLATDPDPRVRFPALPDKNIRFWNGVHSAS
jgi:hypothetical protein